MPRSSPLSTFIILLSGVVLGGSLAYLGLKHAPPLDQAAIGKRQQSGAYVPFSEAGAFLIAQRAEHDSDWIATHRALLQLEKMGELPPAQNARLFLAAIAASDWNTARAVMKDHPEAISGSAPIVPMLATIIKWSDGDKEAAKDVKEIGYNPISHIVLPFVQGWMTRETPQLGLLEAAQDISFSTINMVRFYEATQQFDKSDALMRKLQEAGLNYRLRLWSAAYFERRGLTEEAKAASAKAEEAASGLVKTSWSSEKKLVLAEAAGHLESDRRALALTLMDATHFMEAHSASAIALLYAQTALKLAPDLIDGPLVLGAIYESQENWDEAIQAYESIGPDHPARFDARLRIADILATAGRDDEARRHYDDLVEDYPDNPEAWYHKGEFLRAVAQDLRGAIQAYNKADALFGGKIPEAYWTLYLARGLSYELSGDPDRAEEDYQAALKLQPENSEALNTLAYSWAEKGKNLDKAETMLRRALMSDPMAPHIIDSLGWVLFKKGEIVQAVILLEQASQMMPYDPTVNDHLGDAYEQAGRTREAQFMWMRALENAEDDKQREALRKKLKK